MLAPLPSLRVGDPLRHNVLSVFPLFAEERGETEYVLSDEALEARLLVIEEVSEGGSVPELLVENKGDTRVLFVEGEELVGAKQNRILNTSILIAAHSKLKIPVSCVEQGRWGYRSRHFGSSGSHSPSKVRYALRKGVSDSLKAGGGHRSNQGEVWAKVSETHAEHGTRSDSGAMSDVFAQKQRDIDDVRGRLGYVQNATGLAVTLGGKVLAIDVFDRPSTCEKVWARLLTGFVLDALVPTQDAQLAGKDQVERLLAAAADSEWSPVETVGEGTEYRTEVEQDHGSALTFEENLVHGSVLTAV